MSRSSPESAAAIPSDWPAGRTGSGLRGECAADIEHRVPSGIDRRPRQTDTNSGSGDRQSVSGNASRNSMPYFSPSRCARAMPYRVMSTSDRDAKAGGTGRPSTAVRARLAASSPSRISGMLLVTGRRFERYAWAFIPKNLGRQMRHDVPPQTCPNPASRSVARSMARASYDHGEREVATVEAARQIPPRRGDVAFAASACSASIRRGSRRGGASSESARRSFGAVDRRGEPEAAASVAVVRDRA